MLTDQRRRYPDDDVSPAAHRPRSGAYSPTSSPARAPRRWHGCSLGVGGTRKHTPPNASCGRSRRCWRMRSRSACATRRRRRARSWTTRLRPSCTVRPVPAGSRFSCSPSRGPLKKKRNPGGPKHAAGKKTSGQTLQTTKKTKQHKRTSHTTKPTPTPPSTSIFQTDPPFKPHPFSFTSTSHPLFLQPTYPPPPLSSPPHTSPPTHPSPHLPHPVNPASTLHSSPLSRPNPPPGRSHPIAAPPFCVPHPPPPPLQPPPPPFPPPP